MMFKLLHRVGNRALYLDTDGLTFISQPNADNLESEIGTAMGELVADTPPDRYINRFVSTGAKSYSFEYCGGNKPPSYVTKIRGITLSSYNANLVNFQTMLAQAEQLANNADPSCIETKNLIFKRTFTRVQTVTQTKNVLPVFNKSTYGLIGCKYSTACYGYNPDIVLVHDYKRV